MFGDENFSENLDCIKYGENTILMKPLQNLSTFFLFKSQPYNVQSKLTRFFEKLQNEAPIWQVLENTYITSSVLGIRDVPSLGLIISEISSPNNPELNV
jgi:hypothetical protein